MKMYKFSKVLMNDMIPNIISLNKIKSNIKTYYEDDLIITLDILTFNLMYVHHFQINVVRFISVYCKKIDNIIHKVIEDQKDHVKSEKWKIVISLPLKHIIYGNQRRLTIQHMANKLITDIFTKKNQ